MDREYVSRRNPPPRRSGGRYNRKKSGPPLIFVLALILIIALIVAVVALVLFKRGSAEDEPTKMTPEASSPAAAVQEDLPASQPPVEEATTPTPVPPTPPPEKVPDGDPEKLDVMVKLGDTGYEYYNFVEERANNYITTVCDGSKQLNGSTLYSMIIPTSMDIMLPESYLEQHEINSSDQRRAIKYMNDSINAIDPNVRTISIFDALKMHTDEYIYFRTDHHWTQRGAYYAYEEFCKVKGLTPKPLSDFEQKSYPGFLGSFYKSSPNSDMENNPDTVEAFLSGDNTTMFYTTAQGDTFEQPVIADGSAYDTEWLYLIFCAGDQPYEEIVNSDLSDGSSCIVVKESFGNCFIPFLTSHYQTIYVIDYRYYTGDISQLAAEKGVQDVLLLNNISMTRNEDLISDLAHTF